VIAFNVNLESGSHQAKLWQIRALNRSSLPISSNGPDGRFGVETGLDLRVVLMREI
jgi:hypothetical protein